MPVILSPILSQVGIFYGIQNSHIPMYKKYRYTHVHISIHMERIKYPVNMNKATPYSDRNSILPPHHLRIHYKASDLALLTREDLQQVSQTAVLRLDFSCYK